MPKLFVRIPNARDVCIVSASCPSSRGGRGDPRRNFRVGNLQTEKRKKKRKEPSKIRTLLLEQWPTHTVALRQGESTAVSHRRDDDSFFIIRQIESLLLWERGSCLHFLQLEEIYHALGKPHFKSLIVTQWRVVAWLFEHCDNFSKLTPHFAWCSKAQDEYNCCCHQEKWVAGCWVVGEQFRELCCGTGLAKRLKAGHCWWGGLHHCRHRPPPDLVNVSTLMMKASRKWP